MAELTADLAQRFAGDPGLTTMLNQFCELADRYHDSDAYEPLPFVDACKLAYEKVLSDRERGAA